MLRFNWASKSRCKDTKTLGRKPAWCTVPETTEVQAPTSESAADIQHCRISSSEKHIRFFCVADCKFIYVRALHTHPRPTALSLTTHTAK